jgi:hypothetical protein
MKNLSDIESELLEAEAQRRQADKALSGKKRLPEELVIRQQSEKWAAAWRREERS